MYCCEDTATRQRVAVKVSSFGHAEARRELRRETAIMQRLTVAGVRGVPRLLANGTEAGIDWYAMELVEGARLVDYISRVQYAVAEPAASVTMTIDISNTSAPSGPRAAPVTVPGGSAPSAPRSEVLLLVQRLAEVLHHVHLQGVIHGDISPANVIVRADAEPVLIDFGAGAAIMDGEVFRETTGTDRSLRGTPAYVAPETIRGGAADARSDLYSLGCLLYELLTGKKPFDAATVDDVLNQHLRMMPRPPSLHLGDLEPEIDRLILSLLEKEPEYRLSHASDVVRALGRLTGVTLGGPPAHPPLYRPGFTGRGLEIERLTKLVESARAGTGSLVVVSGPSGIGKTRLCNELCARARKRSVAVVQTGCRSGGGVTHTAGNRGLDAFNPVVVEYLAHHPSELHGQTLAPLRPYLPELFPDAPSAVASSTALDARAVAAAYDSLETMLRSLADAQGLLLQIDDIQWVDELSSAFLVDRIGSLRNSRVLVVAAERTDEESEFSAPLGALADASVVLAPFDLEQTRSMVKDVLATETLPEGLLDYLTARSEGNPFYALELLRGAIQRGLLVRDQASRWSFTPPLRPTQEVRLSEALLEVVRLRTGELSADARELLKLAAILGREFDVDAMALLAMPRASVRRALEEIVAAGVLDRIGQQRFRFASDVFKAGVESEISGAERVRMHRRAAEYFEQRGESTPDFDARLGYHWAGAGEPKRAAQHLVRAARAAHQTQALRRADELYLAAIQQSQFEDADTEQLWELHEQRADVLVAQAKYRAAHESLETALRQVPVGAALAEARLNRKLALALLTQHQYQAAGSALEAAETALGGLDEAASPQEWHEMIQILIGRFETLYFDQRLGSEIDEIAATVTRLVERHGTPQQVAAYCNLTTSHILLRGRFAYASEAVASARRGVAISRGLSARLEATSQFLLGWTLVAGSREEREEAIVHLASVADEARRADQRTLLSRALTYRAIALRRLGRVAETEVVAEQALHSAEDAQQTPYIGAAMACLAWVDWRREGPMAKVRFERSLQKWKGGHPFPFQWLALFPLVSLAARRGDLDVAFEHLAELMRPDQQALPEALVLAIDTARDAVEVRARNEALIRVLALATALDFM